MRLVLPPGGAHVSIYQATAGRQLSLQIYVDKSVVTLHKASVA